MPTMTRRFAGDFAVEAAALTKQFGSTRAVDGVDLAIPRGSVYGILGPNGAGKTSTLRILATLLRPDAGTARVLGHDVVRDAAAVRSLISLTGQFASVDEELTAEENLILLGRLLGHSRRQARQRAHDLLEAFDLAAAAGRLVAQFSGGMRRRLDIAASIFITPELLFLDEPTTGLDPRSRNHVWQTIRMIVAQGTTVLLTTQYLDEADQLADRIAVIDHGKVIAEGTRGELKASVGAGGVRVRLLDPDQRDKAERLLAASLGVPVYPDADRAELTARLPGGDSVRIAATAVAELARSGIAVGDFGFGQPSLDEVFLALTGSRTEVPDHETEAIA
jgi:ABC-2 type transport system ATP-binding protein